MRNKPKWWSVDWIELGCRGWDIDETGAGLGEDGELDWQHAHLDRETLDLILSGRPAFVARALNDLVAAGVLQKTFTSWLTGDNTVGTSTANSYDLQLAS